MKNLIHTITAIVIVIGFQLHANEQSTTSGMTEDRAIEVLSKVSSFGFGAPKGGNERESDLAFKAILLNPKAKEILATVFKNGGTSSKLYALCAFHHIDVESFRKLSKSIKEDELIQTHFGCVYDKTKAKLLIEKIGNGEYDRWFIESK